MIQEFLSDDLPLEGSIRDKRSTILTNKHQIRRLVVTQISLINTKDRIAACNMWKKSNGVYFSKLPINLLLPCSTLVTFDHHITLLPGESLELEGSPSSIIHYCLEGKEISA